MKPSATIIFLVSNSVTLMALVPCKVCGALNSDEAEICLSCEYPTQGRKRPAIFTWAAVLVLALFALPLLLNMMVRLQQRRDPSPEPARSAQMIQPLQM